MIDVGYESRIANGAQAFQGEFPYVASVQTWNDEHLCSGFIYSTYHIVTAASCVYGYIQYFGCYECIQLENFLTHRKMASDIKVLVGTASLIAHTDQTQMVSVYRIEINPSYNSTTKANDVAILKVNATSFY